MKIILVITGLGVGGAEKLVLSLADRLGDMGHIVHLVFLRGSATLLPKSNEVRLVGLNISRSLWSCIKGFFIFIRLCKEVNPDVINSHLFHANILCRFVRIFVPIPRLVSSMHTSIEPVRFRMKIYRYTDRLADLSTNVSHFCARSSLSAVGGDVSKMAVIYSGLDTSLMHRCRFGRSKLRSELQLKGDDFMLLAVGSLNEYKDYKTLLEAFFLVASARPNAMLVIVGDGPLRADLALFAAKLGLRRSVRFLGLRSDIRDIMSAADLFVVSSVHEGLPVVCIEAMACELPIVATDCGGLGELLRDINLIVEVRNPEKLACKILEMMHYSSDSIRSQGRRNRAMVNENFTIEKMVSRYMNCYNTIH